MTLAEQVQRLETVWDNLCRESGDLKSPIRTEIQVSRELVVLLSPDSIERPWVLLEVGAAWGRRKNYRIVPVLCHVSFDAIPDIIEGKKAFHINDFDHYLAELKRRVNN